MNTKEVETRVMTRGYRFEGAWTATEDDVWRGLHNPYDPACEVGDILVELCGYDPGSVPWVENWGRPVE